MKCWVCHRQARGFGHSDHRYRLGDSRQHPADWVFCSMRCMKAFHQLYGLKVNGKEIAMQGASEVELAAMQACLKYFGEAAGDIGFDKPLGDYSETEALRVIDAIVTGFTEYMVAHHEATKQPPIRGLVATCAPAPDPFSDLKDDLPWETKS